MQRTQIKDILVSVDLLFFILEKRVDGFFPRQVSSICIETYKRPEFCSFGLDMPLMVCLDRAGLL